MSFSSSSCLFSFFLGYPSSFLLPLPWLIPRLSLVFYATSSLASSSANHRLFCCVFLGFFLVFFLIRVIFFVCYPTIEYSVNICSCLMAVPTLNRPTASSSFSSNCDPASVRSFSPSSSYVLRLFPHVLAFISLLLDLFLVFCYLSSSSSVSSSSSSPSNRRFSLLYASFSRLFCSFTILLALSSFLLFLTTFSYLSSSIFRYLFFIRH